MKIQVTQEDIKKGRKDSPMYCPIALAIKRTISRAWGVRVCHTDFFIEENPGGSISTWHPLPLEARVFVEKFDKGNPVEPFEFEVQDE